MKHTRKVKLIALGTIIAGLFVGSIGTGIYAESYKKEADAIINDACMNSEEFQAIYKEDLNRLKERRDKGYISSKKYLNEIEEMESYSYKEPIFYTLDDVAEETKQEVKHQRSVYNTLGIVAAIGAGSAILPVIPFSVLAGHAAFESNTKKKREDGVAEALLNACVRENPEK